LNQKQLAEEKILHSLHEKETLILELFHRTKNTMEVIRSFLFLQSANSTNKELLKLVKDTSNRIIAISLVHEKLYNSNNLSSINCKEYIEELINLIIPNYKDPMKKIILTTELENIQILIDTAIPCGLILNELLSNSLKYAFPNNGFGNIIITLSKLDRELLKLTYSDNGIGIPKDFDYRIQNTLGMQIIYSLGEQQLGGKVSFDTNHGVNFSLEFPTTLYTSRV
jgi:two-component sensor histidine kinase